MCCLWVPALAGRACWLWPADEQTWVTRPDAHVYAQHDVSAEPLFRYQTSLVLLRVLSGNHLLVSFFFFFLSRVTITPDGVEAVMRLGQGDMRRVLNLLQSTHMAYQKVKGRITNTATA